MNFKTVFGRVVIEKADGADAMPAAMEELCDQLGSCVSRTDDRNALNRSRNCTIPLLHALCPNAEEDAESREQEE
jgi:hypothetical protein